MKKWKRQAGQYAKLVRDGIILPNIIHKLPHVKCYCIPSIKERLVNISSSYQILKLLKFL